MEYSQYHIIWPFCFRINKQNAKNKKLVVKIPIDRNYLKFFKKSKLKTIFD